MVRGDIYACKTVCVQEAGAVHEAGAVQEAGAGGQSTHGQIPSSPPVPSRCPAPPIHTNPAPSLALSCYPVPAASTIPPSSETSGFFSSPGKHTALAAHSTLSRWKICTLLRREEYAGPAGRGIYSLKIYVRGIAVGCHWWTRELWCGEE